MTGVTYGLRSFKDGSPRQGQLKSILDSRFGNCSVIASCITLLRYIRVSIPTLLSVAAPGATLAPPSMESYLLRTPQGGTEVLAVVHGSDNT